MRPKTWRLSASTEPSFTRDTLHTERNGNALRRPWGEDGIFSIQLLYTDMGVMDNLKTWRLFQVQHTCLFYRQRRESSPKDGKVLPSIGMSLNPAPTTALTTQVLGHLGHDDHEDIAHAVPCSPLQSSWAWGSRAGLCLLRVCFNCVEYFPF